MTDPDLRRAILARVAGLRPGTTCCPSEIARDIAADWRPLMPAIRAEALRLQAEGRIGITQGGKVVAGSDLRGPVRLGPPA
jgi:hypothetical protein